MAGIYASAVIMIFMPYTYVDAISLYVNLVVFCLIYIALFYVSVSLLCSPNKQLFNWGEYSLFKEEYNI